MKHCRLSSYCLPVTASEHQMISLIHHGGAYSRMVFAQGFLPDGQSIIEQMGGLFVFVLISAQVKGREKAAW